MSEQDLEKRPISVIPLTWWGLLNFFFFNLFCILSIICHLRACFSDPGEIPKSIEVPDYVDTATLNCCNKCDMRWKPMRAHHCSECKKCVFKVSKKVMILWFRWTTTARGSITVLARGITSSSCSLLYTYWLHQSCFAFSCFSVSTSCSPPKMPSKSWRANITAGDSCFLSLHSWKESCLQCSLGS